MTGGTGRCSTKSTGPFFCSTQAARTLAKFAVSPRRGPTAGYGLLVRAPEDLEPADEPLSDREAAKMFSTFVNQVTGDLDNRATGRELAARTRLERLADAK